MIIKHLIVEDFGPISGRKKLSFHPKVNTIIGMNGSGKTHIVNLLATLAGNDQATELCQGKQIGYVELSLEDGRRIEMSHVINESRVREFKELLGNTRINLGMTEDRSFKYQHGCCNYDTYLQLIKQHVSPDQANAVLSFHNPRYSYQMGDGSLQKIHLAVMKSTENAPLLVEYPEIHLDAKGQSRMRGMLSKTHSQVIYTTHSPCMLNEEYKVIDLS